MHELALLHRLERHRLSLLLPESSHPCRTARCGCRHASAGRVQSRVGDRSAVAMSRWFVPPVAFRSSLRTVDPVRLRADPRPPCGRLDSRLGDVRELVREHGEARAGRGDRAGRAFAASSRSRAAGRRSLWLTHPRRVEGQGVPSCSALGVKPEPRQTRSQAVSSACRTCRSARRRSRPRAGHCSFIVSAAAARAGATPLVRASSS